VASGFLIITATTFAFQNTQGHYRNYSLGARCFEQGKYLDAVLYLNRAHKVRPNDLETTKYLVLTHKELGNKIYALKLLGNLVEIAGTDASTKRELGDIYFGLDDYVNAEKYYRQSLLMKSDTSVQKKLAEVLGCEKKYGEATAILERLIGQKPGDYEASELLADIYSWDKEYDKAISLYYKLMSSTSRSGKKSILLKLADIMRYTGRDEEAVLLYNQYLERHNSI
jgi:tetratricopeptide (TPR) repeat protein